MSGENQQDTVQEEKKIVREAQEDHTPVIEASPPVEETALREYRKALRQYFVSGQKTSESLRVKVAPVLLAPYLRGEYPDTEFPVLYEDEKQSVFSVRQVLKEVFDSTFNPGEADILVQNLLRIELFIREALVGQDQHADFSALAGEAIKDLEKIDVHGEEGEAFRAHCNTFKDALQKRNGTLIPFTTLTAFHILNLQLKARHENTRAFLNTLKKLIAGLQEILMTYGEGKAHGDDPTSGSQFDFADKLISFKKMEDLLPHGADSPLAQARLKRVHHCLHTLEKAQTWLVENSSFVFVSKALAKEFSLQSILSETAIEFTQERPCASAHAFFKNEIQQYVHIVAALRMADLEIRQEYDQDVHTPYFEGFSMLHLSDEDMQHLPALIVIEESRQLMHQPEDFLELITNNVPVKVLAINKLRELEVPHKNSGDVVFRQELAALALSHRNAYIFQGAADTPALLDQAMREGLHAPCPVLWNMLITDPGTMDVHAEYLALNTAIESRYFPRLVYNIEAGQRFGSRFDISANPQPENSFPSRPLEINAPEGKQTNEYNLTVADYFALDPDNTSALEIIPPQYRNADLIPLNAYFNASQEKLVGKIPFIWMVDEHNILQQAAIPISWVRHCKERLDYWQFIQELGGINSYHVQQAIAQARVSWEAEKETEITQLKAEMTAETERVRTEEVGVAVERLVNALLDPDSVLKPDGVTPAKATPKAELAPKPATASAKTQVEERQEEVREISADAWVEDYLCTSCNDCTDALPAVFKYNSEKIAFVHNPKGGTYAKIVKVAEKCPAKCIHPGLPQNPDEPGLEKLLKRAEKYQ